MRPVRDLAGKPVSQVILGGDSGATLRDMLAAAMLLKSKRVPPRLDFIVAPPSRQVLEVLGQAGALVDLIATGARIIEPDRRVVTGEMYPPAPGQLSLRTSDPEPRVRRGAQPSSSPPPRRSPTRSPPAPSAIRDRSSARCASPCRARFPPTTS